MKNLFFITGGFLSFANEALVVRNADDNDDGMISAEEFNSLRPGQKRRFINRIGEERWEQFQAEGRLIMNQREDDRGAVTQTTRDTQRAHRDDVAETGEELLRGNRLQGAVNYLNRMDAERRTAIANLIPGRQADTRELALAVAQFQSENNLTVDGKPGNNTVRALNSTYGRNSSRSAAEATTTRESREDSIMTINYPPQGREATVALQRLIGTPADGAFGPNSRRQLQRFLRDAGHYTGPIDGQIGRGSRRAIEAYNANPSNGGSVETSERTFLQRLGDFFRTGRNRPNLQDLDAHIDATDRDLHALDTQIGAAVESGDQAQIESAYNAAMTQLRGRIPDDLYNTMSRARTKNQKNRVLDFISNAMMGGTRTVEIANGNRSFREYAPNLNNLRDATSRVLSNEGFSRGFINATLAQMEVARRQILSASSVVNGRSQSVAAFSVRSRGSNQNLQPYSRGSTESISIDGVRTWEVPDANADIDTFINNMSGAQLEDIGREIGVRNLTKERLRELIQEGLVDVDAKMIIAHNCGNVGFELDFTSHIPEREREGGGDNDPGTGVGTDPGEGDDDGGEGSDTDGNPGGF